MRDLFLMPNLLAIAQFLLLLCITTVATRTDPSSSLPKRQQPQGEQPPPDAKLELSTVPDHFEPAFETPTLKMMITGYHPPWFSVDSVLDTAHKCLIEFIDEGLLFDDNTDEQPAYCRLSVPYIYLENNSGISANDVTYGEAYHMLDGLTQFAWKWRDTGWVPSCSFTMDWSPYPHTSIRTIGEMRAGPPSENNPRMGAANVG